MQHTILGVLWWAGGALGIVLSRNNQRTVVPSVIIILTGWAMSDHAQALMISTRVHAIFGYTLMLAGVTRIIEVSFIVPKYTPEVPAVQDDHSEHTLNDGSNSAGGAQAVKTFRHLPPYLLVAAGLLFMSATDEELQTVHGAGMDHVTYILIMFSLSFIIYSLIVSLINLYSASGRNAPNQDTGNGAIELEETTNKWYARVPNTPNDPHIIGDDDD
ncbi:hypothetical protein QCA50_010564 [Cerrena zonata]|uniref:Protein YTP1-like C-terminal domain-containing protein n=1 Tax=Cerrena zonata TaxID=2478898 RepID=A0AAW0FYT3_9APHY